MRISDWRSDVALPICGPEMTGSIYIRRMTTTLSAPPNSYFQLLVTLPSESYVNVGIEVSTALNEFTVRTSIIRSLQFMNEGRVLHAALLKSACEVPAFCAWFVRMTRDVSSAVVSSNCCAKKTRLV